jgi:hypothetical protein
MRFDLVARRTFIVGVGVVLVATAAACGSGSNSSGGTASSSAPSSATTSSVTTSSVTTSSVTTSTTSSTPGTGTAAAGNAGAIENVRTNWETFFSGRTSAATKISLLQNGQKFATVIRAQAGSGLASTTGAKVKAVVLTSMTMATVSYDITFNGVTGLPSQTGTAMLEGGVWKVGDAAFCDLLRLEGNGAAPSVCSG